MEKNTLQPIIRVEDVSRVYHVGAREVPALQDVSLAVRPGQLVALRGRSGSGKTTLLNCISGLDRPTAGAVWLDGQEITRLSERRRVELRRRHIGFVFQSHALLPTYSARENVDLMLRLIGLARQERQARTQQVLRLVGLSQWMDHRPYELSGGQPLTPHAGPLAPVNRNMIQYDNHDNELSSSDVAGGELC